MKLSMARVSVSSCRPQTSSSMVLRETGLPSWLDQVAQQVRLHQRQRKYLSPHAQLQQVEVHGLVAEGEGLGDVGPSGRSRSEACSHSRRRSRPRMRAIRMASSKGLAR